MNYIKEFLLTTLLLSTAYSQCDANGDGDLNIQDIIVEVNCILDDCWEEEPSICVGLTEVELWGEYYDIGITYLDLHSQGLTCSIPPENRMPDEFRIFVFIF